MRSTAAAALLAAILTLAAAAPAVAAGNPSGTGLPSQSCQDIETAGGSTPGHASSSPGSPFNEPGINSTDGGVGGQHYNETSQYDVACYQVSQH
jgi:opacity protein-like surface antigen